MKVGNTILYWFAFKTVALPLQDLEPYDLHDLVESAMNFPKYLSIEQSLLWL